MNTQVFLIIAALNVSIQTAFTSSSALIQETDEVQSEKIVRKVVPGDLLPEKNVKQVNRQLATLTKKSYIDEPLPRIHKVESDKLPSVKKLEIGLGSNKDNLSGAQSHVPNSISADISDGDKTPSEQKWHGLIENAEQPLSDDESESDEKDECSNVVKGLVAIAVAAIYVTGYVTAALDESAGVSAEMAEDDQSAVESKDHGPKILGFLLILGLEVLTWYKWKGLGHKILFVLIWLALSAYPIWGNFIRESPQE